MLSVYYDKICLKLASHHFLLYVVYMCQNHWILPMHSNVTIKNVSWPHFSWRTLYASLSQQLSNSQLLQEPTSPHKPYQRCMFPLTKIHLIPLLCLYKVSWKLNCFKSLQLFVSSVHVCDDTERYSLSKCSDFHLKQKLQRCMLTYLIIFIPKSGCCS